MDVTSYPRRIYIDLGLKDFESSLCWMMQNYPASFDGIYGFECARDLTNVAALATDVERCLRAPNAETAAYGNVADVVNSIHIYHNYVGLHDNTTTRPATISLSRFLTDVGVTKEDFVVMKMDVEGLEYELIGKMLADGSHALIDEVR